MNIDVVLVSSAAGARATGGVLVATSANTLVGGIRRRLGAAGRIDRLRILDSWDGPGSTHPLKAVNKLTQLRELFSPAGEVRVFPGPAPAPGKDPTGSQAAGMQGGFQGGLGGFGGAGRLESLPGAKGFSLSQLSRALGVPVKAG